MAKPYKLGFIGGSIHSAVGYTHRTACQLDGDWQLVAGCFSQDKNHNDETASAWDIAQDRVYENWQSMLASEKGHLDAVLVLTPTTQHTEIVLEAINAGYPVICEKALTTSSQEGEAIRDAVKRNNGFLAVTYNYTGYPMLRELKNKIENGELGKIHQIQIEMPQEGFIRVDTHGNKPQPQSWRLKDENIPVLSLDLGVHLHHIVHFLTGEKPLQTVADQFSNGWFPGITDSVMAIVKYSNELHCQMWYSKTALGNRNGLRVRVYGNKASAEWYQMDPELLKISLASGTCMTVDRAAGVSIANQARYERFKAGHPAGFVEAFANLYRDIANAYTRYQETGKHQSEYAYDANHALEGLRLFEAIDKSARSMQWVTL